MLMDRAAPFLSCGAGEAGDHVSGKWVTGRRSRGRTVNPFHKITKNAYGCKNNRRFMLQSTGSLSIFFLLMPILQFHMTVKEGAQWFSISI
jgi:hypothetical protein